jgi:hypothetical protein
MDNLTFLGWIFIPILVFIFLYARWLSKWSKKISWHFSSKLTTIIKCSHYCALFLCLIVGFLFSQYNSGLRGLWTTRIFIIVLISTGIFFILFADKSVINKIERIYFKFFSYLPIIAAGICIVPFYGLIIIVSLYGKLTKPADDIFYQDKYLRVQSSYVGEIVGPRLEIYKKECIFEKNIMFSSDFGADYIDSVSVRYDYDSTRIICKIKGRKDLIVIGIKK